MSPVEQNLWLNFLENVALCQLEKVPLGGRALFGMLFVFVCVCAGVCGCVRE